MSLTKQQLLDAAKPQFEWIEVPPFGKVGIRSLPSLQQSRRELQYYNADGSVNADELSRAGLYLIIDQVCSAPDQPLFTEDDIEQLAGRDYAKLKPLVEAILKFNGEDEAKNGSGGLSD